MANEDKCTKVPNKGVKIRKSPPAPYKMGVEDRVANPLTESKGTEPGCHCCGF